MQDITYSIHEVASSIYQLKMPLPFRLDHINLYLLEDNDGWILIDTGLNTETSQVLWEKFITSGFFIKPIKKILLTHLHPDHIGMAAWLSGRLGALVFMSQGDWKMAQFLWKNDEALSEGIYSHYWKNFGVPEPLASDMVALRGQYKMLVKVLPEVVTFIKPNEQLFINNSRWILLPGIGHSPEHLCLWNSDRKILISGDHILPTITPNISYHPVGLDNPLECYLNSLEDFLQLNCNNCFPAHGPILVNYHERIHEIILHHQHKLALLMNSIHQPITVYEAMPILFTRDLPKHQLMFAFGETAAHLLYLVNRKFLKLDTTNEWRFINNFARTSDSISTHYSLGGVSLSALPTIPI